MKTINLSTATALQNFLENSDALKECVVNSYANDDGSIDEQLLSEELTDAKLLGPEFFVEGAVIEAIVCFCADYLFDSFAESEENFEAQCSEAANYRNS